MDKINTDDLLVKILSYLPTKVAVTTSILSKRWKFLWMWVPKLEYHDCDTKPSDLLSLQRFIKKQLPLHKVPVLESLRLEFSTMPFQPEDITLWVEIAVSRKVRNLGVEYNHDQNQSATLPICLYTCKSLETLSLQGAIFMDVPRLVCLPSLTTLNLLGGVRYLDESFRVLDVSRMVRFPSLKSLIVTQVDFFNEESLQSLLANCPCLEDLIVERHEKDNVGVVSIKVPSLKSLEIYTGSDCSSDGVEIVAPSLTYIRLEDHSNTYFLIENMPKLEKAYIEASSIFATDKFLGSFKSVKRLTLCLVRTEAWTADAIFFNQLESLKICTCCPYWSIILVRMLKGSPKLKVLKLYVDFKTSTSFVPPLICWDQLAPVPECLLTTLETFKWRDLPTTQEAIDMVAYITKHSRHLKSETVRRTWLPGWIVNPVGYAI